MRFVDFLRGCLWASALFAGGAGVIWLLLSVIENAGALYAVGFLTVMMFFCAAAIIGSALTLKHRIQEPTDDR